MKLNVHEIEETAKRLVYEEPTAPLNSRLVHGGIVDFEFPDTATVCLDYYRAGQELFFHGRIDGAVVGHCARCLAEYPFRLATDLTVMLVPKPAASVAACPTEDDRDLSYYAGDEVDLTPLVDEQIILALPTRPLCTDACRGLCPHCGINLNEQGCQCETAASDPRLALFRQLKVGE